MLDAPCFLCYKYIRFLGQAVKTSPSHGENKGSIPLGTAQLSVYCRELFLFVKLQTEAHLMQKRSFI